MKAAPSNAARWAIAVLATGLLLLTRVVWPWPQVFGQEGVVWPFVDSWYHARLIDHMATHFPQPLGFDPLALFPQGQTVPIAPGWEWLVVGSARLAGIAEPGMALARWAALWPPFVAVVVSVASFDIGRRLFGPQVGWLGLLVLAALGGGFLSRTLLGAIDHHAAELLWSVLLLWGLLRALDRGRVRIRDGMIGGALLAAYLLSWAGGALLVAVLLLWVTVDALVWPRQTGRRVLLATLPAVLAALVLTAALPVLPRAPVTLVALGLLAVLPGLLWLAAVTGERWAGGARRGQWGFVLFAFTASVLLLAFAPGQWMDSARGLIGRFGGSAIRVGEATPIGPGGLGPALGAYWVAMGVCGYWLVPALAMWFRDALRTPNAARLLVLVWVVGFFVATLGQLRFALYLSPFLAIGSAWMMVLLYRTLAQDSRARAWLLTAVVTLTLVIGPNVVDAWQLSRSAAGPDANQLAVLDRLSEDPSRAGVLARWDVGWWLVQRAGKAPFSNPTQANVPQQARMMLAPSGRHLIDEMQARGLHYLWLDDAMVLGQGEALKRSDFGALAQAAGYATEKWWVRPESLSSQPVLYRADYYRLPVVHGLLGGFARLPAQGPVFVELDDGAWRKYAGYAEAVAGHGPQLTVACPNARVSCVAVREVSGLAEVAVAPVQGPGSGSGQRLFELQ